MDDKAIVALYFDRNQDAITQTHIHYGTYCHSIAEGILQNHADAEECVNDAYLKLWQSIPPQNPQNLRTYVGKITRNLAINRLRASKRQKRNPEFLLSLDELSACIPAPDEEEDTALTELFNQFLSQSDPLDRKLFVGRYCYIVCHLFHIHQYRVFFLRNV